MHSNDTNKFFFFRDSKIYAWWVFNCFKNIWCFEQFGRRQHPVGTLISLNIKVYKIGATHRYISHRFESGWFIVQLSLRHAYHDVEILKTKENLLLVPSNKLIPNQFVTARWRLTCWTTLSKTPTSELEVHKHKHWWSYYS